MLLIVPYIKTAGTQKFKEFLQTPFVFDMLYPLNGASVDTLFADWHGKDMRNWFKFRNEDGVVLEFYPEGMYVIKKKSSDAGHQLATPRTIDEFISDMDRFGIPMQWSNWIDDNFEPKDYLPPDEIKSYFAGLLTKMGKAHELL